MTHHSIYVVHTVVVSPVENFLHGVVLILVSVLCQTSAIRCAITDVGVVERLPVLVAIIHITTCSKAEIIGQVKREESRSVNYIASRLVLVGSELIGNVAVAEVR